MPNDAKSGLPPWTVLKILQWTTAYFKQHDLDTPRIDAEILLAHALRCQRIDLYLRHDQPLNEAELADFKLLIKRRIQKEPVAYIVGFKEFWSLRFNVTAGVLIPRPDTECLVEKALSLLPARDNSAQANILELGVGSGAIIVALAHERPTCRYWASDISWAAIQTARQNANLNRVGQSINFFVTNWFEAVSCNCIQFDLIVTNPPYIASNDIAGLSPDIRDFEPLRALDGGPDGLKEIRLIVHQAYKHLKPGGWLLIEIGFDQREAVQEIIQQFDGYNRPEFHRDLGGQDRVAMLQRNSEYRLIS
ncbi:MAG: peptide chain release factor N(5)-glutamine methyltransferase [Desulfobacteraceae bacterium]|nr:peptide chain release factor N(5)-glutamine methyltransferase [Desulfobacteraceae bacterium]